MSAHPESSQASATVLGEPSGPTGSAAPTGPAAGAAPGAVTAPAVGAGSAAPTGPAAVAAPAVPPVPETGASPWLNVIVLARARWPAVPADKLTPLPAFIASSFSPLVAEVAERCLRTHYGRPPADPARGERTAIVLASRRGDVGTTDAVTQALAGDRRVPPLLFFQSNINAVVGHVAARWGLAGPVVCASPVGDPLTDGLSCACLLFDDGDAAEALVIAADQAYAETPDSAAAVLVAASMQGPAPRARLHESEGEA